MHVTFQIVKSQLEAHCGRGLELQFPSLHQVQCERVMVGNNAALASRQAETMTWCVSRHVNIVNASPSRNTLQHSCSPSPSPWKAQESPRLESSSCSGLGSACTGPGQGRTCSKIGDWSCSEENVRRVRGSERRERLSDTVHHISSGHTGPVHTLST